MRAWVMFSSEGDAAEAAERFDGVRMEERTMVVRPGYWAEGSVPNEVPVEV